MKRSTKKGFTIVELVIVIAIIAILAAVLIPTFASLIQKANTSADIQAVREMNTFLATNEVTGGKDITDVYAALAEGGMTAKDYHPLVSGRLFFWDKTLNRVLYTNDQYEVIYPEEYKDVNREKNGWLSLSGEIRKEKIDATEGTYIVTKAEQLYYLVSEGKATNANIKLDTPKLDLMGADIGFKYTNTGNETTNSYTFSGQENGMTTITGLAQLTNGAKGSEEFAGRLYASGLIQEVVRENTYGTSDKLTVTVQNITIEGSTIGDYGTGSVGAVVGRVKDATLIFDNVHVKNTVVLGKNKVGGLLGYSERGIVTIKDNCSLENVTVNCVEGESGKVVGILAGSSTNNSNNNAIQLTCPEFSDNWVKNVTLNLVSSERKTAEGTVLYNGKTYSAMAVEKIDEENEYRLFFKDANICVLMNKSNNVSVKIGDSEAITNAGVTSDDNHYEFAPTSGEKLTLTTNSLNPELSGTGN